MTVAKQQHAKECERQHQSEGVLMEQLGRLLGEFKASARYALQPLQVFFVMIPSERSYLVVWALLCCH